MVILFQNSVFGEILFYPKSLTHKKATPYPSTKSPCGTDPNNNMLLPQAPVIPEKETKILKNGACGDEFFFEILQKCPGQLGSIKTNFKTLLLHSGAHPIFMITKIEVLKNSISEEKCF